MHPPAIKDEIRAFYLDYVNNYLTVKKLAAEEWARRHAPAWRNDCDKFAWQQHNQTAGA